MASLSVRPPFFGHQVVRAAFTLAVFAWGVGFYGLPVYLNAVVIRTGWPLSLVSSAVTVHCLAGVVVISRLPTLHRRYGVGPVATCGAAVTGLGVIGWALAQAPWQLFVAAIVSGAGWVTMAAVAVNAIIVPWFERDRPLALGKAYNGASIGGVIFSPLWVVLNQAIGFPQAATLIGLAMVLVVALLSARVFSKRPDSLGQGVDGDLPAPANSMPIVADARRPPALAGALWRNRRFQTLAAGMAIGSFAQTGMIAHLLTLLVPVLGARPAGLVVGFATGCGMAGRYVAAVLLKHVSDRRLVAAVGYAIQLIGVALLMAAGANSMLLILFGVALFGSGIGNVTSMPPLIAQSEFARQDVPRVVASIVATAQATYAFAPAAFALVLAGTGARAGLPHIGEGTTRFFATIACTQVVAIALFLLGRSAKH
ncbi:MAG TPA: MFS transporter [Burkholderiaceae bacterium]|nr:MFS transporter [Burkholderiaceae bacterium]